MRIQVNKKDLENAIASVSSIIKGNSNMAVLNSIKMEFIDNAIVLTGANNSGEMNTSVETDVVKSGDSISLTTEPRQILNGIKGIPDESIILSLESNNNFIKLSFKYSNGQFTVHGDTESIYPTIIKNREHSDSLIPNKHLIYGLNNSRLFVAKDDLRPVLCGVNVSHKNGITNIASTDGHKLFYYKFNNDEATSDFNVVLPIELVEVLSKHIKADDESTNLKISDNSVEVDTDGLNIKYRLIEGNFPNYLSIIPKETSFKVGVDADSVSNAVKRVSVFSNSASKSIILDIDNEKVNLTARDIDYGTSAEENLMLPSSNADIKIGFNSDNLLNVLTVMKGEEIDMGFNRPDTACVVRQKDRDDIIVLLMPMMI